MKRALNISVARKPKDDGIAAVRSIEELAIREMKEDTDEALRDQQCNLSLD